MKKNDTLRDVPTVDEGTLPTSDGLSDFAGPVEVTTKKEAASSHGEDAVQYGVEPHAPAPVVHVNTLPDARVLIDTTPVPEPTSSPPPPTANDAPLGVTTVSVRRISKVPAILVGLAIVCALALVLMYFGRTQTSTATPAPSVSATQTIPTVTARTAPTPTIPAPTVTETVKSVPTSTTTHTAPTATIKPTATATAQPTASSTTDPDFLKSMTP